MKLKVKLSNFTLTDAVQLSIVKWDLYSTYGFQDALKAQDRLKIDYNHLIRLRNFEGLCQLYLKGEGISNQIACSSCPLYAKMGYNCFDKDGPYQEWRNKPVKANAAVIYNYLVQIANENNIKIPTNVTSIKIK
jgi:hypothetical protein